MQEAQTAGCRTSSEAQRFIEQKRKEAEENAQRVKENGQAGPSGKVLQRPNSLKGEFEVTPHGVARGSTSLQPFGNDSYSTIASSLEDWDITGFAGADLLSETVRTLFLVSYFFMVKESVNEMPRKMRDTHIVS